MIVRVNVVLNRTVVVEVIFRVKVSCITSVDGIILWSAMLLVVCQLSRDGIGNEDS